MVRGSPTRTGGGGHREQVIMAGPPVTTRTARVDPSPCRPPACHAARCACGAALPRTRPPGPHCPGGGRRVASASSGDPVLAASHPRPGAGRRARRGRGRHGGPAARAPRLRPARPRPGPRCPRRPRHPPVPRPARSTTPSSTATTTRFRRPRAPSTSRTPAHSPTRSETVRGGTTLVLADGTYDGDFTVRGVNATPEAPVVVRAANPGKAVVGSGSALVVKGSAHVVVAGLTFRSGASTLLKLDVVEQRAGHAHHLRPGRRRRGAPASGSTSVARTATTTGSTTTPSRTRPTPATT